MIYYFHGIVVLSVVLSSIFVLRWQRGISVHFAMIFLFIPVINLGYLKVATAQSVSEALLANSIEYFDGCFLELFFFLYVMNFCKLKMPSLSLLCFEIVAEGEVKLTKSVFKSTFVFRRKDNIIVHLMLAGYVYF